MNMARPAKLGRRRVPSWTWRVGRPGDKVAVEEDLLVRLSRRSAEAKASWLTRA